MNKSDLMSYAAHGVRQRLAEMQREINTLARDFPDIVRNQDGTVPSVLPVTAKGATVNGVAPYPLRKSASERSAAIAAYVGAHPGATTKDIAAAVGLSNNHVLKVAPAVATMTHRGQLSATWVVKKKK